MEALAKTDPRYLAPQQIEFLAEDEEIEIVSKIDMALLPMMCVCVVPPTFSPSSLLCMRPCDSNTLLHADAVSSGGLRALQIRSPRKSAALACGRLVATTKVHHQDTRVAERRVFGPKDRGGEIRSRRLLSPSVPHAIHRGPHPRQVCLSRLAFPFRTMCGCHRAQAGWTDRVGGL